MEKAIDAFNRAVHSPGRMKRPTPREISDAQKEERKAFKKHVEKSPDGLKTCKTCGKFLRACICPPKEVAGPRPEFEPYVHVRGVKKGAKYRYQREIPGEGVISAGFRTKEAANRFARTVNNIYREVSK